MKASQDEIATKQLSSYQESLGYQEGNILSMIFHTLDGTIDTIHRK